jgi:hypothetical protein
MLRQAEATRMSLGAVRNRDLLLPWLVETVNLSDVNGLPCVNKPLNRHTELFTPVIKSNHYIEEAA